MQSYPHKFTITISTQEFNTFQEKIKPGEQCTDLDHSIAGRIKLKREAGNIIFYTLVIDGDELQVVATKNDHALYTKPGNLTSPTFKQHHKQFNLGDIIGFHGFMGKSKRGHLSLFTTSSIMLAPCLEENFIVKTYTTETGMDRNKVSEDDKYNKRYKSLMNTQHTRDTFVMRSRIISHIRNYLDRLKFMEVETPILSESYSGASAEPFRTRHKYLRTNMFMRIAPELYLKKLIVGGLDRVYEIGKQFRNENIDATHNPEFTSLEYYMAYADYNDLMKMTEDLLSGLVHSLFGGYKIKYTNHFDKEYEIDFTPPFKRVDMLAELEKQLGTKLPDKIDSVKMQKFLMAQCTKHTIECPEPLTVSRLLDRLVGHFIETDCINPTFIINHPLIMSPLAKEHRNNPQLTERFELFISKFEICNAYTELNSPDEQHRRFENQMKDKSKGDLEAHMYDESFITALRHGMPPTGGFGMGIDRLVMLLTNNKYIKDVILFPPSSKPSNEDSDTLKLLKSVSKDYNLDLKELCDKYSGS
jgi:lysyl-tRNA synthetase class 2